MAVANNKIDSNKKCRQIAGGFDGHVDAAVQCGMHRLMEHIPGFTRSHWMLPPRQVPALNAAKVINFGCKHTSLTKHNF
jgi:hypothetical protein